MKSIVGLLFFSLLHLSTIGQEQSLDLQRSSINWTARSTVTGSYSGKLSFKTGSISIEGNEIVAADVVVDMLSLEAENKELEKHIRNEDFFDVEKYPTATFTLRKKALIQNATMNAEGTITIIGESQEMKVQLKIEPLGNETIIKGKVTIDRTKFGIYHNSPSFITRLKEKAIADEFEIELALVFR